MRLSLWLLGAGLLAASAHAAPPLFTPEQLRQDLQFMRESIDAIHPEPEATMTQPLDQAFEAAQRRLDAPMTRDGAWRQLARLNPLFADAHLAVLQPQRHAQVRAHLAAGGGFFPFEVQVTQDGKLFIRAALGGKPTPLAGTAIERVNGVPAARLVRALMELVHGDTPDFRAELLSRRWWFYYWKAYGAPARYTFTQGGKTFTLDAGKARPEAQIGTEDADFDRVFQFALLDQRTALLTIRQFAWPDKARFLAFTAAAFARMREAGTSTLLIDVRENGGGEGERVGDVVKSAFEKWEQPEPGNPLRFEGRVYVLVGAMTYSSAVVFSNVMQDFGFGQLAGSGAYARSRQSGGVQERILPHTGLALSVPRFVLDRPAGDQGPRFVQPDIELADDPFDRRALVNTLLQRIGQQTPAG